MRWDPFRTLRQALWIGGGQWAGKSTVAGILAERHGLVHYHYDYHDARGHLDRRTARRARDGDPLTDPEPETVAEAVEQSLAYFVERFAYVQDDLRALASPRPVVADGWGLRPELVVPVAEDPRRMVVLVPTEGFRRRQIQRLPRAGARPEAMIERDRLIAADAVRNADRLNVPVIEVDGTRDAEAMADVVAEHFRGFLQWTAT
jgi:2-phosphoglycerate kinase